MVNDLSVSPDTVKFVDDTTIWEIIRKSQTFSSVLPAQINECTNWVLQNNVKLNPQKTKEIQICYSSSDTEPPLPITINGHEITLVPHAKLLGSSSPRTSNGYYMSIIYARKLQSDCTLCAY